jgi:hypothetical protein
VQTVEPKDDFYVRDWTDSPTSGDDGSEPSIKPVFYATSDIWNRRGTLPGGFPNDQPANEDAGNGVGNIGDNWLFARVRRRAAAAAGAPDVTVNAHFLVSKLGTGSNYEDASDGDPDVTLSGTDPTLVFAAAETGPKSTAAFPWHLNPIASTHLCVAVQISTPTDPFVFPSLHGRAPGWPTTDLDVVDDNNKAQRNMGLSTTPARGTGLCLADSFGIVHNAATFPRDIEIRYTVPPEVLKRSKRVAIEIPGQKQVPARPTGTFTLAGVQPGENRWVGARLTAVKGAQPETLTIVFDEMLNGSAVNGFGLGIRLGTDRAAVVHALHRLLSVSNRLVAGWAVGDAERLAEVATTALATTAKTKGRVSLGWLDALRSDTTFMDTVRELLGADDPFKIQRQVAGLRKSLAGKADVGVLVCLCSYLERIDAHLTMLQLSQGDRADVLQNVTWQRDILTRLKGDTSDAGKRIDELSAGFVQAWDVGKAGARDFPGLVRSLLPPLEKLVAEVKDPSLREHIHALAGGGDDVVTLQRLHRELLLGLQAHVAR